MGSTRSSGLTRIAAGLLLTAGMAFAGSRTPLVPISSILYETTIEHGVDAAIDQYHELRRTEGQRYDLREFQLNLLGYRLIRDKRFDAAVRILQLNVEMFPASVNAHDSLGEAYLRKGDLDEATREYRRALMMLRTNRSIPSRRRMRMQIHARAQLERIELAPVFEQVVGIYDLGGESWFSVEQYETNAGTAPPRLRYFEYPSGRVRGLYPRSRDLVVAGAGQMVASPVEMKIRFVRDHRGVVVGADVEENGSVRTARRLPFPLRESVAFNNGELELAGTLALPGGPGPFPAITLLHGSGSMTRDMLGFGELTDFLVLRGFAVLRYDKRGTGESTSGRQLRGGFPALAGDALAGMRYLQNRPEIDSSRVGFLGFSEGAWVAVIAAAHSDPAFLILLSGGGVPPWQQESYRVRAELEADGFSKREIAKASAFMQRKLNVAATGTGWEEFVRVARDAKRHRWFPSYTGQWLSLRMATFAWGSALGFDPQPQLQKISCPTLAVLGELDRLTPVPETIEALQKGLVCEGEGADLTWIVFPRANHLLLEAETGSMRSGGEFQKLARYAPGYFDTLGAWLQRVENPGGASPGSAAGDFPSMLVRGQER